MPHWRLMMSSDKLCAADLLGRDCNVVVAKVTRGEYPDHENPQRKIFKPDLHFVGKEKPLGLNSTNARAIAKLIGTNDTDKWTGKVITIYPTTTRAFGEEHECIRIRPKLPDQKLAQQVTQRAEEPKP